MTYSDGQQVHLEKFLTDSRRSCQNWTDGFNIRRTWIIPGDYDLTLPWTFLIWTMKPWRYDICHNRSSVELWQFKTFMIGRPSSNTLSVKLWVFLTIVNHPSAESRLFWVLMNTSSVEFGWDRTCTSDKPVLVYWSAVRIALTQVKAYNMMHFFLFLFLCFMYIVSYDRHGNK